MQKWYYDSKKNIVRNDNHNGYAIDYVGNLFGYSVKEWEIELDEVEELSKSQAFDKMILAFELELEIKEFRQARLLEEVMNDNIKKLLHLQNSISKVV